MCYSLLACLTERRGEAEVVLATGSENMSLAPHLTYGTRFGTRFEGFKVVDMLMDALTDAVCLY